MSIFPQALQWRHNEHDDVSNHQPHYSLLNRLFRCRSMKTSKLHVTGPCAGNSLVTVYSPYKCPVTRKMFPFDDAIMVKGSMYLNFVCPNWLACALQIHSIVQPNGVTGDWDHCKEFVLTHWGRVTHICVNILTIIGSDNGILLIWTLGTNVGEILREIHAYSFKKIHLKMSSAKGRLFSLGLNELIHYMLNVRQGT